jgi:hypothetical protein
LKTCSHCGQEKLLTEFNKKRNRYQPFCRSCQKQYAKQHYQSDPAYYAAKRDRQRLQAQEFVVARLTSSSCIDCGESDIVTLEFDHLRDKVKDISSMVHSGSALSTIEQEIEKCEIVCANCHRRRTASRSTNWYKLRSQVA